MKLFFSISAMQSGKTPGPDGYPIEFYKNFSPKLAPLLLEMFNHSLNVGTLPQTLTEANIILLLKHGKNPTDCASYRPISLLNADVKILAKLLAIRLDAAMADIISSDQTGFMRGRHSFSNIRRLISVVHSPVSGGLPRSWSPSMQRRHLTGSSGPIYLQSWLGMALGPNLHHGYNCCIHHPKQV